LTTSLLGMPFAAAKNGRTGMQEGRLDLSAGARRRGVLCRIKQTAATMMPGTFRSKNYCGIQTKGVQADGLE
jgi:hypothetical protein